VINISTPCPSNAFGGHFSGNPFLVPLVGGSGGGGANTAGPLSSVPYGTGGGAGGGAVLIASSSSITVNGKVSANGGKDNFGTCSPSSGGIESGSGSGGGIRLAAPTINGSGTLTAVRGTRSDGGNPDISNLGGNGVIRLEAFTDNFTGSFNGTPVSAGSPFSTFIPANGPPSVKILSVNGVSVTQPPTGNLATPDVTINQTAPVSVTVQATNIPPGTVLTLRVFSDTDMDQTVQTTPLLGTLQASTATATVTFPSGFSLSYVKATWTP